MRIVSFLQRMVAVLFSAALLLVSVFVYSSNTDTEMTRFVDEEFQCSFYASKTHWRKSENITFSLVPYGYVEFVNKWNFSSFTFHAEVANFALSQTLQTITDIIRGRSRQIRTIRDMPGYTINGMKGHRREIVFVSTEQADFTCAIVILRLHPVQYTFVFFSPLAFSYESQAYFSRILRSFTASPIENQNDFILKHNPLVFRDESFFNQLNMLVLEPEKYAGRPVTIRGFVYREASFPDNRALIARMYTPPRGEEALPYGLMFEVSGADRLPDRGWFTVTGVLRVYSSGHRKLPLIVVREMEPAEP